HVGGFLFDCRLIVQLVQRCINFRNAVAFYDEALQELVLEFSVSCYGTHRIENCEDHRIVISSVCDAGKCADASIGAGKRVCFTDHFVSKLLVDKSSLKRSDVDFGNGQHVLGLQIVEVQPENELAEKLNGSVGCDPVEVE